MIDMQLRDLYQEVILEHSRHPCHYYSLEEPYQKAVGNNPLCGDKIIIYVRTDGELMSQLSFQGQGCAICMASASLMVQTLQHQSVSRFHELFNIFKQEITRPVSEPLETQALGKLQVVLGVREFPMRIKCATLAWHTLNNALKDTSKVVTTE